MNPASLPSKPLNGKTYKHFKADSCLGKEVEPHCAREFFYIGSKSRKIDILIKIFSSGYTAETIESAKVILKRIAERNKVPDIIIVDASVEAGSLKALNGFLMSSTQYSVVPLVVDAADLSVDALKHFQKYHFIDEIIFLKEAKIEHLKANIQLLKKLKAISFEAKKAQSSRVWFLAGVYSKNIAKRLFDVVISALAIILLSPVFLLIAFAIKLESKGPVFYVAKRAGRGYRVFNFFKFRTMVQDADKEIEQLSHLNHYRVTDNIETVFFKVFNDSRITKLGTFLRNTSMDELPQFFNVLMGDMSLVGNRPLPLYEAAKLTTDQWAERFMAPAGITGLWQIKKRTLNKISIEERINLDIAYAKKYNFMYDLWIIANTPSALIQRSNA